MFLGGRTGVIAEIQPHIDKCRDVLNTTILAGLKGEEVQYSQELTDEQRQQYESNNIHACLAAAIYRVHKHLYLDSFKIDLNGGSGAEEVAEIIVEHIIKKTGNPEAAEAAGKTVKLWIEGDEAKAMKKFIEQQQALDKERGKILGRSHT